MGRKSLENPKEKVSVRIRKEQREKLELLGDGSVQAGLDIALELGLDIAFDFLTLDGVLDVMG